MKVTPVIALTPRFTLARSVSLVWFYGISKIIGYLMPNPIIILISNIWFANTFCRYTYLNEQIVLFLAIQFSIKVKLVTVVEGDPKAPFSITTTPRCRGGRYSFPWIAPLYP